MNKYKFIVIYSLLTKLLFWFSSSPLKFGSRVLIVKDVSSTPNLNQMEPLGEKSRVKFATVRYVTWSESMQIYWKKRKRLHKKFNSHRTGLGHKHGRRFIVLGHKYGRRFIVLGHKYGRHNVM